ncbi:MAG: tRNA (guanosine(37)-N1)-methyltransferase TrmD [Actinobacteria bacterium]|nr:MAG: tRNA (guanosine(37)-N1)-methyltransferase TrmD [Actinomycetota bacterium]
MRVDIISAFPDMFKAVANESIIKIAREKKFLDLEIHNLRDFTTDKHRSIDDTPYGGGPGMLLKAEPFFLAVEELASKKSFVVLLTPQGELLNQKKVQNLSKKEHFIMLCGHYEGVDERVRSLADAEISIGDYVLTGGELPAMVLLDSITRKQNGVLGSQESLLEESFEKSLLEYPQYTKPAEFRGMKVPDVLLSGNHQKIASWRAKQAVKRTSEKRPDLLKENK